jgi:peptidoglycan hydrolase-like protein with peptidoglycan-binding domain
MYLGFDPGPLDGIWGKRTRSALNQYQAANGLASTQDLEEDTFRKLVEDAQA